MMLERPLLLIAAAIITVTMVLLARWARARRIAAAAGWSAELGRAARLHGIRSPWLLGAVALLAGIGLTGPRWGLAERVTESRALNVVLVMDISRSMLAQDVAPDRLTRALGIARRLVQDLDGDRLGLIAFAARPYLLAPLTLDQSALTLQLDALDPEVASEGGSAQGAALVQARAVLDGAIEGGDKVVVMLTDGESFEGEDVMLSAASSLRSAGITLVVVPVGTPDGSRIPAADGGWHLDGNGVEVITRRRDDLLTPLVAAAEGVLIAADSPDPTGDVRRALSRLERAEARDRAAADLVPRAWLFALGAALVLGVQTVTRRSAALAGLLLLLGGGRHRLNGRRRGVPCCSAATPRQPGRRSWRRRAVAAPIPPGSTPAPRLWCRATSQPRATRWNGLQHRSILTCAAARSTTSAPDCCCSRGRIPPAGIPWSPRPLPISARHCNSIRAIAPPSSTTNWRGDSSRHLPPPHLRA
ncbi:MAG: VWA domain-containing protein, partial [Gemmatimonadales bacterium]|nr:VWA domain-containing protein [Gemmatimonadales bacterium]